MTFVVVALMHSIYADSLVSCFGTFLDNVSDDLDLALVTVYLLFPTSEINYIDFVLVLSQSSVLKSIYIYIYIKTLEFSSRVVIEVFIFKIDFSVKVRILEQRTHILSVTKIPLLIKQN